jgi:predicted nucleic-acid-binding Zn-ribbon protein
MRAGRCPKCRGNLYFETDLGEGLLLRKCLQCGLIESYFWLERSTRMLVRLPIERDLLPLGDGTPQEAGALSLLEP